MNDVIRLAAEQAATRFGPGKTFNAAHFSKALVRIAGLTSNIDGELVRAILAGRDDIAVLPGGSHYELL